MPPSLDDTVPVPPVMPETFMNDRSKVVPIPAALRVDLPWDPPAAGQDVDV